VTVTSLASNPVTLSLKVAVTEIVEFVGSAVLEERVRVGAVVS
jgi:hypothetical protein